MPALSSSSTGLIRLQLARLQPWIGSAQTRHKIRAGVYGGGLQDNLVAADVNLGELGRRFILPSSFTGGDRFMQQLFSRLDGYCSTIW